MENFRTLDHSFEQEVDHREIHDAVPIEPEVHGASPIFRRHRWDHVILSVITSFHVCRDELCRSLQQWIDAPQYRIILRVQVMPPETLHNPWCFADLITPRRRRIGNYLAWNRVCGVREISPGKTKLVASVILRHRQ